MVRLVENVFSNARSFLFHKTSVKTRTVIGIKAMTRVSITRKSGNEYFSLMSISITEAHYSWKGFLVGDLYLTTRFQSFAAYKKIVYIVTYSLINQWNTNSVIMLIFFVKVRQILFYFGMPKPVTLSFLRLLPCQKELNKSFRFKQFSNVTLNQT